MKQTYKIDFSKSKKLYHFTEEDISADLIDANLSEDMKGTLETTSNNLVQNGGFVVLPSAQLVPSETENFLAESKNRTEVLKDLLADRPLPGLLGILNFKQAVAEKIQTIEIAPTKTLELEEDYLEESLTIDFSRGLSAAQEMIDIDLNIYGLNAPETKGVNDRSSSGPISKLDVLSEAVFYDESGKETYREFLIPATIHDVNRNGVVVNLNNQKAAMSRTKRVRKKKGLIKRIVIIIRKFAKNVRNIINNLKRIGVNAVIEGLKAVTKSNKRYKILKYDPTNKEFKEYKKASEASIDPNLRTLIFIHGTAKGSFDGKGFKKRRKGKGSFHYLYNNRFNDFKHWIDHLMNQKSHPVIVQYQQILALEHETIVDDPEENVRIFYEDLGLGQIKFTQPISIVSASRGSLVAKQFSVSKFAKTMDIERVAIVSGGYSNFFDEKEMVQSYVNSLGNLFTINKPIQFILSLTIDIIYALPGLEVHKENGVRFPKLIAKPNNVCYFNMVNDYKQGSILKKAANKFLGPKNDLLLSMDAQKDFRPGFKHPTFPELEQGERHGNALRTRGGKLALFYFLTGAINRPT